MQGPTTRARVFAALFVSLFASVSFAQVTAVTDRVTLDGDDFIDWQDQSGGMDGASIPSVVNINTDGGMTITVAQISPFKDAEPSSFVGTVVFPSNLPAGGFNYYLYPYLVSPDSFILVNPLIFTDFDGEGICGFGTQIAPYEAGGYVAWIEVFDADGASMLPAPLQISADTTTESESVFIGFESTDPAHRVEVSMQGTADGYGSFPSFYAINQVDLKACVDEPEVPVVSCSGFEAPMDNYPVKTKKNRVFPLKMELFDADDIALDFALTDLDLAAPPVVEVMYTSSPGEDPVEPLGDLLPVGKASEGNQFVFEDGIWQFKLSSKGYTAAGTYLVTAVSGDETEYVIDPSCITSFTKK